MGFWEYILVMVFVYGIQTQNSTMISSKEGVWGGGRMGRMNIEQKKPNQ